MWRSQLVVILLVLRDRSILLLHLRGWRLDHFETKNLYTYDQRIKEWRIGSRSESLVVQKVRKKSRFKVVFIGIRIWQRSMAGTLKSWPVPLKLRGPPYIIKGAAHLVISRFPELGFWQKICRKVVFLDLDSSKFNSFRQYSI